MQASLDRRQQDGWPRPPGIIESFSLGATSTEQIHTLVQHGHRGKITLVAAGQEGEADRLALFRHNATQLTMAALVDGCSIDAPRGQQGSITLAKSDPAVWHYLHLRDQDLITFTRHGYNLGVNIVPPPKGIELQGTYVGSLPSASADVQVKSSAVVGNAANSDDDSTNDELGAKDDSKSGKDDEQIFSTARGSIIDSPRKATPPLVHQTSIQSITGVAETPLKELPNTNHIPLLDAAAKDIQQPIFSKSVPPKSAQAIVPTPSTMLPPQASATPISSIRSKRKQIITSQSTASKSKRVRSSQSSVASTPDNPKALMFSTSKFQDDKKVIAWLKAQGMLVMEEVPHDGEDYVCVIGEGELCLKTKLLHSLVLGRTIVSDKWLEDSKDEDQMLQTSPFRHPEVIKLRNTDRSKVFDGLSIFITTGLHKKYGSQWKDVLALLHAAGAGSVLHGSYRKAPIDDTVTTLFIADGPDDVDARRITSELELEVCQKNILWQSILDGRLPQHIEAYALTFDT